MFGACLPTIVTLVIFIVAINAFSSYSRFQNRKYFYEMSCAYNSVIYAGFEVDEEYISLGEEGKLVFNDLKIINEVEDMAGSTTVTSNGYEINIAVNGSAGWYTVSTSKGYAEYKRYFTQKGEEFAFSGGEYTVKEGALSTTELKTEKNNNLKNSEGDDYIAAKAKEDSLTELKFLQDIGSLKSAENFRANDSSFLWVKNIWVSDVAFKHPVESSWDTFKSTYSYEEEESSMTAEKYGLLIKNLEDEQSAPNGYFILVALTALSSLGMQLITSRSQKAQMELQTVDGQGAQTQKIMTWMMPIMMAFFAFMYTAAFSIYIIISSVISLLTTLLINKIADKKFKKVDTGEEVIRGRVYTPPKEEPKKETKKVKKNAPPENDFLSGLADKRKKPRGRIK